MTVPRRILWSSLFLALALALAAPAATSVADCPGGLDCGILDGDGGSSSDTTGVDPNGQSGTGIDPNPKPDDLAGRIGDGTNKLPGGEGSNDNVGGGLWNPGTYRDIAPAVVDTLAENWVITGLVTFGLVGSLFAGWVLASRYIDPKVALRSPERSMLYGFVKGNPGVHLKQLSTEFKMKTSTVLWHIRKLEAADLLRSKKANGYRVFYPVSGGMEASRISEAVTTLSNPNARSIFGFIVQNQDTPFRTVSDQLGINSGTIRWHLKKLRQAGLLEDAPEGRGMTRVTELGLKAWNQVRGVPQTIEVPLVPVTGDVAAEEAPIYSS